MRVWIAFGEYIDYITKLGIYCKLYDRQFSIQRSGEQEVSDIYVADRNNADFVKRGEAFEEFMMQNKEKMHKREMSYYTSNEISLFDGENEVPIPQMQDLRKAILEKFSTMNLKDIENSEISQYEYRKIIGMKYHDIELTPEDIEALSLYKHGKFDEINGFLRGNLNFLTKRKMTEEEFVKDMPRIIEYIRRILSLQERFISDNEITLARTDKRINNEITPELEYDNFVSTTANHRLFLSGLDGIEQGGYIYINVPKGTPMIPMDITTEKEMFSFDHSRLLMGKGDIGFEESEILLPMCDLRIDNHRQNQNGKTIVNATIIRQKNPIEIMEKRLEEMQYLIIQYGGYEKFDELKSQIQAIKFQTENKAKFSEQEIGKTTINTPTMSKASAQSRTNKDENEVQQIQESKDIK